jgi:hypothetical protein
VEYDKTKKLLNSLKKRYEAGEISQDTYLRLSKKWNSMLPPLPKIENTSKSSVTDSKSLLDLAMKTMITRAYVCDNCGAAIQVKEKANKIRCNYCGVINEIDYLERIASKFETEKKKMLQGVISNLVTSSLASLKLPAYMKFKSIALPYENRAMENEANVWPKLITNNQYTHSEIYVKDQCLEASKHRHHAAELYQNASEFATRSEDKMEVILNYYLNEGLGFLNASLSFYWIVLQEGTLLCKQRMALSAIEAVKNFLQAYNTSHNDIHLNYAVLSKILVYNGAQFWLGHHENQEMLALIRYLKESKTGQFWDNSMIQALVIALTNKIIQESSSF